MGKHPGLSIFAGNPMNPEMKKYLFILAIFAILTQARGQDVLFYALSDNASLEEPISLCKLDTATGEISIVESFAGVMQGNYMAISPDGNHLLVTSKNKNRNRGGLVQFSIADDGSLTFLRNRFKPGGMPCHVSFTPDGKYAMSASYGDDQVSLYTFKDGVLGPQTDQVVKPDQSKGHYIQSGPSSTFVHAVFLGQDKVLNFMIEDGSFVENPNQLYFSLPQGYGPRHMVFHPNNMLAYILNELDASVTGCAYNADKGVLNEFQNISMLPDGFEGNNSGAAIRLHPNGWFLYASNRGHNSIVVYQVQNNATLVPVQHATENVNWPRDFNISPDGKFLLVANQKGDSISVFSIDQKTGMLTPTGNRILMPGPLAILFLP